MFTLSSILGSDHDFHDFLPAEPFVSRGTAKPINEVFNTATINRLLATNMLRPPFIALAKDGKILPPSQYTWAREAPHSRGLRNSSCPRMVRELADAGATVILNMLPFVCQEVYEFTASLGRELGMPIRANAFLTPVGQQGFKYHYDTDSVFVIQIEGAKRWQVVRPYLPQPLEPQHFVREAVPQAWLDRMRVGDTDLDVTLEAGDVLWLPRGWLHNPFSEHSRSLHLTLGVQESSVQWLAEELVRTLTDDVSMRADLPIGFARDRQSAARTVRLVLDRLRDWLDDASAEDLGRVVMQVNSARFLTEREQVGL